MNTFTLNNIDTSYNGFGEILKLHDYLQSLLANTAEQFFVDLSDLRWIDGNLCACLGALLWYHNSRGIKISTKLHAVNPQVKSFLSKNGFLSLFGQDKTIDTYEIAIEFKRHKIVSLEAFKNYIVASFSSGSKGLPAMSPKLLRRFRESLFEIFLNAVQHAQTSMDVFSCGQFFPKKERLAFCITDLGIGIKANLEKRLYQNFQPAQAIDWAMQEYNTTSQGRPGGLGLKLIREFITYNEGRMIIVSDAGYWELERGQVLTKPLGSRFPGTVVLIEINTADPKSYRLKAESEIDLNNIF